MAAGNAGSTLVRNTLANGLGGFASTAVGILLAPYLIAQLGVEAYGVYTLALTLSFAGGYAALSDLGIEQATVRYVAEAEGDGNAISAIIATTLAFFTALAVVLGVTAVLLAPVFVELFSVRPSQRAGAEAIFALIGAQLVFEMPARAFTAVVEGTQHFVAYQAVELSKVVLIAIGTVIVLATGGGLTGIGLVFAGGAGLALVAYWVLAHRLVPTLRVAPWHASRAELRRLLSYGTSVFAFRFNITFYRHMDKIILGAATRPALVGLYEIANKLHLAILQVHQISTSAVTPAAATARRDPGVLREMFLRGTQYTAAFGIPATIAALVFAGPLLRDWIGPEAVAATSAAQLLLVYLLLKVFENVGTMVLVALGRVRRVLVITVAVTGTNLLLSIVLVGPLEIDGVLLGTLIATALGWLPMLRLFLREFGVGAREWLARVLVPQLPGAAATALVGLGLYELVEPAGSLALDALAALAAVGAGVLAYVAAGARGTERAALLSALGGAVPTLRRR